MTWRERMREGRRILEAAGIGEAEGKLRWWLSDRFRCSLLAIPWQETPGPDDVVAWEAALARLGQGEPVQYVCGRAPFMELELVVTPAVLIPRPETEQLVDWVLRDFLRPGMRVLDVGTGSGCIALAIKHARPDCEVQAVDVSAEALAVARENARCLGLDVVFRQASLLEGQPERTWDLIVANLPYIGEEERAELPVEVREHEPALALFADEGGTALVAELMRQAVRVLAPDGKIVLETGESQGHCYRALSARLGYHMLERRDAAGRPRFYALDFSNHA